MTHTEEQRQALENTVVASLRLAALRTDRDYHIGKVSDAMLAEAEYQVIIAAEGLPRRDNW